MKRNIRELPIINVGEIDPEQIPDFLMEMISIELLQAMDRIKESETMRNVR